MPAESGDPPAAPEECPRCGKPATLCVCDGIVPIDNRIELVILQHPQEQDRWLGTARLAVQHLTRAQLRIGLSWPSLAKAAGHAADAKRWAVLYLGATRAQPIAGGREVVALDRKGTALADQDAALAPIVGAVILDGTWSQAKALWWRNPWMLKCQRVALAPARPSRFGHLRYEPRPDALSTIEAAALLLAELEKRPEIATALNEGFDRMLARYVAAGSPRDPASRKARRPGKGAEHRHPRDRRRRA